MLEDNKKLVGDFLTKMSVTNQPIFDNEELQYLLNSYSNISKDIDILVEGGKIANIKVAMVQDTARLLVKFMVEKSLPEDVCDFVKAFGEIIYNWNTNTVNDPDIDIYCKVAYKMTELCGVMNKSRLAMIESARHMRDYGSWYQPSYEINLEHVRRLLDDGDSK